MENIRKATLDDHEAITGIYNHAVEDGLKTADTEKISSDEGLNWMQGHLPSVADFNGKEVGQFYYGKRVDV